TNLGTYFPGYQGQGYEIAGIGWHQGWNDRVNQAHNDEYEVNMANFIRDIRVDLGIADLPFVIATTGMTGWTETHPRALSLMNAQLAVAQYPEFQGNVFTVETRGFYRPVEESPANQGYHWNRNAATYLDIGVAMGEAMTVLAPDQCPSRLQASGGPDGVTLTWQNGENLPSSVRILRNSAEIASAAPVDPPSFLDAGALPGVHDYELIFTMPGDPPTACDPLTIRFDGCTRDLEAVRYPAGVVLTWTNGMPFDGIEIRRGGTVLAGSLAGTEESFTDTSPPAGRLVTYSVTPTNGSCPPATVEVDFDTVPAGRALVYEPFDYPPGGLDLRSGNSEVGLQGDWNADATTQVAAGTLAFGGLPVGGGKLANFSAGESRFGGSRALEASALADRGLLDDNATLWFSALMGAETGGNINNARLALALANSQFNDGSSKYWINDEGAQAGSGLGVTLGRFGVINATPVATQFRDLAAGDGTRGNVYGSVAGGGYGAGEHGLIVGTFTWGATPADPDVIAIYQPGPDLVLPAAPVSTLSVTVDQSTYDTITFARGDKVVLDEIRFGAEYGDVIGAGGPVSDYDSWAANFPGVDLSDPGADHDGDGLSNDEERIWGLDPVNAAARNPIGSALGPAGGFSYTRRDPALTGLVFSVWTSTDLRAWTEDTGADQAPDGAGGNAVQTVSVMLSSAALADPRLFVQIRAGE
ncbi:MAG: hypothetical protein HKO57_16545, partial [Akkermansiaceae bacterium]|nr:hypothetical protein [Akkermansiaceae bacterium]